MTPRRLLSALGLLAASAAAAQQPIDSAYTKAIRELTPTDPKWVFTTELVNYLPASATVPSPLKVLGYVPGTVGKLSHVADINRYFRALAAASPRVKLFSAGMSDEGREMLLVAIGDSTTIAHLDDYRAKLARLSDTRGLGATERAALIRESKPIYWLTGSIHSPETGSPEMLMELAYRLAVDESDHTKAIRDGVITLITPVLEPALRACESLGIVCDVRVVSAHRTPLDMVRFARGADARGTRVIIAGAGGAAHLPGMVASLTPLPVIGVPVESKTLRGIDSLLSIVQMPPGIPVATVAIGAGQNAGLLAVQILAASDPALRRRVAAYRARLQTESRAKDRRLRRSLAPRPRDPR